MLSINDILGAYHANPQYAKPFKSQRRVFSISEVKVVEGVYEGDRLSSHEDILVGDSYLFPKCFAKAYNGNVFDHYQIHYAVNHEHKLHDDIGVLTLMNSQAATIQCKVQNQSRIVSGKVFFVLPQPISLSLPFTIIEAHWYI